MTTIAWRDGILATDSLVTTGSRRAGLRHKGGRVGPLLFAHVGDSSLCLRWEAWLRGGMVGHAPPLQYSEADACAYIFMPDGQIAWFHKHGAEALRAPFWAGGSGAEFALGAMSAGASAEAAVASAITHDIYSGGPIQTFRVAA